MIEKIIYTDYTKRFQCDGFVDSIQTGKLTIMKFKKLLSYYYTMKYSTPQTDYMQEFIYVMDNVLEKIYLSDKELKRFTMWCLGYRENEIAKTENISQKVTNRTLLSITRRIYDFISTNY